jgi:hypothetical protein
MPGGSFVGLVPTRVYSRRMLRAFVVAAVAFVAFTGAAQASNFGRLFPDAAPLNSQTPQQLADLAQTQLDPNADSENNCAPGETSGTGCLGSGFTYFGQFIDHDITLDTSASPTSPVDPATLVNHRTFALDLDSVYGDGPDGSPELYRADGEHFRVQDPNENGVRDLPRRADGSAILVEPRNDENEIISQIHVAFLMLHNKFIDGGMGFDRARAAVLRMYHRVIRDDFLPHTLGPFKPGPEAKLLKGGMTPIEFSVAAFRYGHSQVRRAYELNETTGKIQVFSFTLPDLRGGRDVPAGREINWGEFLPELADPDDANGGNISRKIDTLISSSLFQLPIPGAEADGSNVLAFRNMIRAKFYDMPSGQTVADLVGAKVLTDDELAVPPALAAAFADGVPLWYYVLREASVRENGRQLGPVGSRIVGDVFDTALGEKPKTTAKLRLSDLLVAAGVAERPT